MGGTGQRLPYTQAFEIAQEVYETLRPHCARIEIAGSIRRQREDIGDRLWCINVRKPIEFIIFFDLTQKNVTC
jgi:hypothetical protein